MRLCIPIQQDDGLKSPVHGHFGSAPFFLVYDTEARTHEIVVNSGAEHAHGMCNPLQELEHRKIDAVACRGMGLRAVLKLKEAKIRVLRTTEATVEEVIASHHNSTLAEMTPQQACQGHHCH